MRAVLVLVLVVLMTPALHGVQAVVHLVADGHLDHDEHADEGAGDCEHDCTPLSHQCRCHAGMSVTTTPGAGIAEADVLMHRVLASPLLALHDRLYEPPPLRPPIS